jgi:hypothetical protein
MVVPLGAVTDSDHRDLSSAATQATTVFSEAITMAGQPESKAIMGFRASVVEASAAEALAEAASGVEDFTAAEGGGNDEQYIDYLRWMVFALTTPVFAQQRFDSADAAARAVIDSTEEHDGARLAAIFGPQGNAILTSGSVAQDRAEQAEFSKLASTKHHLIVDPRNPDRVILSIGDEDWPFPVPIVHSNGKWSFDASEARMEMDARRIGVHELDAIEICAGYVEAQQKYASTNHSTDGVFEYASHMTGAADSFHWCRKVLRTRPGTDRNMP